jgi:hypothetical protein
LIDPDGKAGIFIVGCVLGEITPGELQLVEWGTHGVVTRSFSSGPERKMGDFGNPSYWVGVLLFWTASMLEKNDVLPLTMSRTSAILLMSSSMIGTKISKQWNDTFPHTLNKALTLRSLSLVVETQVRSSLNMYYLHIL